MRLTTALSVARTVRPQSTRLGLPTVSVVVPCYNYGRYLNACVESALSQEDVDVDVLIIDDASPDRSGDMADAVAASRSGVRVIRHSVNQGHIATYNEGLALIEGTYVVLLSADDLLAPGSLARAVALMEANPNVGLTYGRPVVFEKEPPAARSDVESWSVWPGKWWIAERCRQGANCIHSPEVVMRTSVQRRIGGYRPSLPHAGDLEMWLRAASVSDVGHVNGADQAYRRFHAGNMSKSFATSLSDAQEVLRAFETFFAPAQEQSESSERLLATARRSIAAGVLENICSPMSKEGTPPPDLDELLDFARALTPDAPSMKQWRELRWYLTRIGQNPVGQMRHRFYCQRRRWDERINRRLWSWRGI
jgi:glycosyltransferase involved in cell wall biosynthesis